MDPEVRLKTTAALRRVPYGKLCVQGPAGTGKTDFLAKDRVVATSHSNLAVDNVKARVMKYVLDNGAIFLRLGVVPIIVRHFHIPLEAEHALLGCVGADWKTCPTIVDWTPELSPASYILSLLYPGRFPCSDGYGQAVRDKLTKNINAALYQEVVEAAKVAASFTDSTGRYIFSLLYPDRFTWSDGYGQAVRNKLTKTVNATLYQEVVEAAKVAASFSDSDAESRPRVDAVWSLRRVLRRFARDIVLRSREHRSRSRTATRRA